MVLLLPLILVHLANNAQGKINVQEPPWKVTKLPGTVAPTPFPASRNDSKRILEGIKVLELCRIIAGPTVTRILAEYGADVLKITSPNLSDVPFFQVDGNMGKHAADLDLKTETGRQEFEKLLADVDVIVDGYRPGALAKLGYGPEAMAEFAEKRGKGIVYVNENCFGYEGEWASRAGWQQIADCVSQQLMYHPKHWTFPANQFCVGDRYRLGTRPIHGPIHPRRAAIPHLRLRHRLHGRNRRVKWSLPPRQNRRFIPRQSLADALRSPPLRNGSVPSRSAGRTSSSTAA